MRFIPLSGLVLRRDWKWILLGRLEGIIRTTCGGRPRTTGPPTVSTVATEWISSVDRIRKGAPCGHLSDAIPSTDELQRPCFAIRGSERTDSKSFPSRPDTRPLTPKIHNPILGLTQF